jgi:hypothetical protein
VDFREKDYYSSNTPLDIPVIRLKDFSGQERKKKGKGLAHKIDVFADNIKK